MINRLHRRSGIIIGSVIVHALLAGSAQQARAVVREWIVGNGNFGASGSWNPSGVPDTGDTVTFRRGAGVAYNTTFVGNGIIEPIRNYETNRLRVGNNIVTFRHSTNPGIGGATYKVNELSTAEVSRGIFIGELGTDIVAVLNVSLVSLTAEAATLGEAVGSNGTLNLNAGVFNLTATSTPTVAQLIIGNAGTGALNINNGADVTVSHTVRLADKAGSMGTLSVNGNGSTFTCFGLTVGNYGTGTLMITGGGSVSGRSGIAVGGNSIGTATVTGSGSHWNTGDVWLRIGDGTGGGSKGTLRIESGGAVTSVGAEVGNRQNNVGMVEVRGMNSECTLNGPTSALVGNGGNGSVLVEDKGRVTSGASTIVGLGSGGEGKFTVTGEQSQWNSTALISIGGMDATGTLSIEAGGSVMTNSANIGASANSTGTMTVAGTGSRCMVTGTMGVSGNPVTVLPGGTGIVNIVPGGSVTVGQDLMLFPNGVVSLQGGTLDASVISFQSGGQFQWTSGTLHVGTYSGNLTNSAGTLAPGHSPGSTTIAGTYTQQSGAKLDIEIGGVTSGTGYDAVTVTGVASLGGELRLSLINGFVPSSGNTFVVLNALNGLTGAFSNVANGQRLDVAGGNSSFRVNYGPQSPFNPNQVVLSDFVDPTLGGLESVYEPFAYDAGPLLNKAGGKGFSAAWSDAFRRNDNYTVTEGSLGFPKLRVNAHRTASGALPADLAEIARPLGEPLGQAGTTKYISFLVRPEGTLDEGLFGGFFGITFGGLFIGKPGGGALHEYVFENPGGAFQNSSGAPVVIGKTALLVIRANFLSGNDVFTLYVNPVPGESEPASGTIKNDVDVGTVSGITIYSTGAFSIDEIRIGASFAAVTPTAPLIPADLDFDGDVDGDDYDIFQGCSTGPALGPVPQDCQVADFDEDGDIDQSDFGGFQRCFSGEDVPADPNCAE